MTFTHQFLVIFTPPNPSSQLRNHSNTDFFAVQFFFITSKTRGQKKRDRNLGVKDGLSYGIMLLWALQVDNPKMGNEKKLRNPS